MKAVHAFGLYLSKRDFRPSMIRWAVDVLCSGGDGVATTLLAGADYQDEDAAVSLFRQAAVEQGVQLPAQGEELEWLELWTCKEIVAGRIAPRQGLPELSKIWDNSSFVERFSDWMVLAESVMLLEEGYGGLEPFESLTLEAVEWTIMKEARAVIARRD